MSHVQSNIVSLSLSLPNSACYIILHHITRYYIILLDATVLKSGLWQPNSSQRKWPKDWRRLSLRLVSRLRACKTTRMDPIQTSEQISVVRRIAQDRGPPAWLQEPFPQIWSNSTGSGATFFDSMKFCIAKLLLTTFKIRDAQLACISMVSLLVSHRFTQLNAAQCISPVLLKVACFSLPKSFLYVCWCLISCL